MKTDLVKVMKSRAGAVNAGEIEQGYKTATNFVKAKYCWKL